ncbi:DUF4291 domain-containing protein [Sinosporangium siamense]|uniref:DUF4291 domain-containing protein n=1 Tax=Sinosporangium siamense TaxID=1367973 RepID=A0A919RQV2_9ACTN|nr:DUF4291 domain-containing protein [Sinosporangium siamense]GII96564.1 hypothetical protein Ssi02_67950 [Sinosporangium siamense]
MTGDYRQIRADYDENGITVYQAYGPHIAIPAAKSGRFPETWSRQRMTWIKPSFLWMMYRSGWAGKPGQEHVVAVRLRREGFEDALRNAGLSHYDRKAHADHDAWARTRHRQVRVQWDPERDLHLHALPHRSLQVGLSGAYAARYADEWILDITDITDTVNEVRRLVADGDLSGAAERLPLERPYPVSADIATTLGM